MLRALFRLLHGLAARPHSHYPYPKPSAATQRRLERDLGFEVTPGTNDGVVPTLSQLHGRLLYVARADHLDARPSGTYSAWLSDVMAGRLVALL